MSRTYRHIQHQRVLEKLRRPQDHDVRCALVNGRDTHRARSLVYDSGFRVTFCWNRDNYSGKSRKFYKRMMAKAHRRYGHREIKSQMPD